MCEVPFFRVLSNRVPDEITEVIDRAFDYWGEGLFFNGGQVNFNSTQAEGPFVLVDVGEVGGMAVGSSRLKIRKGCIIGAVLTIKEDALFYPEEELETLLRHEVGHLLGLGHSSYYSDLLFSSNEGFHPKEAHVETLNLVEKIYSDKLGSTPSR